MNEPEATLKLLQDYQENGRIIGSMANVVHSRAKTIHYLTGLLLESPQEVAPVPQGFEAPIQNPMLIERVVFQLEELSMGTLYKEVQELAKARQDAVRLERCLRTAGFPDYIRRE